ncbi:MAG: hypothetical protein PHV70_09685, partial [Desulfobacteraceae bacterium]|nr:hypothetical protein [Desulfobacteraceae bacterium]
AIVIPRSLRRGISSIRYYYTFRFTKRSLAALGMTIRIFYESIILGKQGNDPYLFFFAKRSRLNETEEDVPQSGDADVHRAGLDNPALYH